MSDSSKLPVFIGWQELPKSIGGGRMALFNLVTPMDGKPAGSTVTDRTLLQNGFDVTQVAAIISVTGERTATV